MPLLEVTILRLLADSKIEYFEDSAIFRTQVLDNPEAAAVLVRILLGPNDDLAARSGEMLSLFGHPAWKPVLEALPEANPQERLLLIQVAYALAANVEEEERAALLPEAAPSLRAVLRDRTRPRPDETDAPVEIEYRDLRVCDQAYLLMRSLAAPFFDETLFRDQDDEDRDAEIRRFSGRMDLPVA